MDSRSSISYMIRPLFCVFEELRSVAKGVTKDALKWRHVIGSSKRDHIRIIKALIL